MTDSEILLGEVGCHEFLNIVIIPSYPLTHWCQVNGVPSPQSLGHILSEDEELNEISDELPQVYLVNIY